MALARGTLAIPDCGIYIGPMSIKPAPVDRSNLSAAAVAWMVSREPVEYPQAIRFMEARTDQIARGEADELIWLLEHSASYTAGTSARPEDLLAPGRFPVHTTGRGGKFTYHGPGQRVIYVMLDVKRRSGDVRAFVAALEGWVITALAELGVTGERRPGRVGIWVPNEGVGAAKIEEAKIAAIGLRLRHWVSMHGISLNVDPNLEHYSGIVPCGITGYGVTSLAALGRPTTMDAVDKALRVSFERCIAPVHWASEPIELNASASVAS